VLRIPSPCSHRLVRYPDVGLATSVSTDELLREAFEYMYLAPLASEPDGGETLRQTLRAYFAAGGNVSSAAATLRVNRQTMRKRLRAFERKIGQSLDDCGPDLVAALRVETLSKRIAS
jgi:DNA-binding PucR family transcriptional regulator